MIMNLENKPISEQCNLHCKYLLESPEMITIFIGPLLLQ